MLNKKKRGIPLLKEVLQHIILIFVALVVLLPIIEVLFAGVRKNQAVFGPHIGLIPTIDLNTWIDSNEADRRENVISKKNLINRFDRAVSGMSEFDIIDTEMSGKSMKVESGSPEAVAVKDAFKKYIKSNGNKDLETVFLDKYKIWEQSVSEEDKQRVGSMFFTDSAAYKLRYIYEERFTFNNFKVFFTGVGVPDALNAKFPMVKWFLNSIIVAGSVALVQVIVTALASYVLSRFRFKGKKLGLMIILTIQVFPGTMAMVALYLLLLYLGNLSPLLGIDSKLGLILVYLGGGIPFNIWLVKGYFDTIPKALEESAMIDGATPWQAFITIILPLVRPILAVTTILSFVGQYNEFVLAQVILRSPDNLTMPVGLRGFIQVQGAMNTRFGIFSAASFVGSLPIVVLWLALQNQIISGLTGGSVKG